MTREEMMQKMVEMINADGPIKGSELVVRFIKRHVADPNIGAYDVTILLDALVTNGEIIEIEYTVPTMNYRVKSMYFPAGSEITILNK
jgi:hypothetical protein